MIAMFLRAYLIAWLLGLGLSLGCLVILLLHHLVGGRWGASLRPTLEAGARGLWIWALAFVPLALGVGSLYAWTDRALMAADPVLAHKSWYLCSAGYALRSLASLALWSTLALVLTHRSRAGDTRPGLAVVGLLVLFPSVTISATDWLASLDPHFSSSMFGLYALIGQILAGLAAAIVLADARKLPGPEASSDHAKLLLTALMLWAYIAFSHYLLVWSADLPAQAAWYLDRRAQPWSALMTTVVIARVGLALPALLLSAIKRHPRRLALVAGALLLTYVIELVWLVLPAEGPVALPTMTWLDLVLPLVAALGWAKLTDKLEARTHG